MTATEAYSRIDQVMEENATLLARIEELERALEPFAKMADSYDPPENDDGDNAWYKAPKIGDLRRARAALATPAPADPIQAHLDYAIHSAKVNS